MFEFCSQILAQFQLHEASILPKQQNPFALFHLWSFRNLHYLRPFYPIRYVSLLTRFRTQPAADFPPFEPWLRWYFYFYFWLFFLVYKFVGYCLEHEKCGLKAKMIFFFPLWILWKSINYLPSLSFLLVFNLRGNVLSVLIRRNTKSCSFFLLFENVLIKNKCIVKIFLNSNICTGKLLVILIDIWILQNNLFKFWRNHFQWCLKICNWF